MNTPPFFKQENQATCSLAVLRMVLKSSNIEVSELELEEQVKSDYGSNYSNIWNPTIAKLACEYGLYTKLYADWPLLKENVIQKAINEYKTNPIDFNAAKYENPSDSDRLPEPLPLAYKEMFRAIEKGCQTEYGALSENKLIELLNTGYLIQTSIKLELMYPESKPGFHSILIYAIKDKVVYFHDPSRGPELNCPVENLLKATTDVGAFLAYQSA